jgi:hypothetical protein
VNSVDYLLKTFSMNPFQGQHPNMPVRTNAPPVTPEIHRKTPEMKKAKTINITPVINRGIPFPFLTFFILAAGVLSLNSSATDKKSPFPFQKWIQGLFNG